MQRYSRITLIFLINLQIIILPLVDSLSAQTLSADLLIEQARKSYYEGNFDQAVALIKTCLQETTLDNLKLQEAYIVLAQTYLAKNYNDAAREVVIKLLDINPLYSPTIEHEPPPFVTLVEEVRQQNNPPEPGSDNKWLWIGAGGALMIGAVTFIIFNKNGSEPVVNNKLGDPPPMPDNP